MKEKLAEISTELGHLSPKNVCVEAAHVYSGENFDKRHKIGAEIGAGILDSLSDLGIESCAMLFVDDLSAHNKKFSPGCYKEDPPSFHASLQTHGFNPEKIVLESSLIRRARHLIYALESQGIAKSRKQKRLGIGESRRVFPRFVPGGPKGMIYLESVDFFGSTTPSCVVLDAVLYLEKLRESDVCITILPKSYRGEQSEAKYLVRATGNEQPIINIYFDDEGKIDIEFDL